ncbi:glycoside hydrolase family 27 protein [Babesia caballi]|uniref:Glycoside hydrolase family 27 protein n=1 Tax=Babesia caballi TaxID=5871 RepID=A0AAV4LSW6_BABCB|nr:glycoside hydrolase family 27 protein [Babesia caballi]
MPTRTGETQERDFSPESVVIELSSDEYFHEEVDLQPVADEQCKLSHAEEADAEEGHGVVNVEDADKVRRPHLYKNDLVAEQYLRKRETAAQTVAVVGGLLIGVTVVSGVMMCRRGPGNKALPCAGSPPVRAPCGGSLAARLPDAALQLDLLVLLRERLVALGKPAQQRVLQLAQGRRDVVARLQQRALHLLQLHGPLLALVGELLREGHVEPVGAGGELARPLADHVVEHHGVGLVEGAHVARGVARQRALAAEAALAVLAVEAEVLDGQRKVVGAADVLDAGEGGARLRPLEVVHAEAAEGGPVGSSACSLCGRARLQRDGAIQQLVHGGAGVLDLECDGGADDSARRRPEEVKYGWLSESCDLSYTSRQ